MLRNLRRVWNVLRMLLQILFSGFRSFRLSSMVFRVASLTVEILIILSISICLYYLTYILTNYHPVGWKPSGPTPIAWTDYDYIWQDL